MSSDICEDLVLCRTYYEELRKMKNEKIVTKSDGSDYYLWESVYYNCLSVISLLKFRLKEFEECSEQKQLAK